ncbi:hypothetical protein SAMN04487995_3400, partial [Dyadobacter koreensis]
RPTMKPKTSVSDVPELPVDETPKEEVKSKPAFRPTMKPKITDVTASEIPEKTIEGKAEQENPEAKDEIPKPKPAFRPTMKPKPKSPDQE